MKASTKSLHTLLYKFTYKSKLPINLCPYFWKLVWAIIVFIPNLILQLPIVIYSLFDKTIIDTPGENRSRGLFIYLFIIMLFGYLYITYHWIKAMFKCYSYNDHIVFMGIVINCIIAFGALVLYITYRFKNRSKKDVDPSIIGEFIKAKYGKYCPKIDWE